MSEYMEMIYDEIEKIMAVAQRQLQRGVLPQDVQARLPYRRAEGSVRRDMMHMAKAGRLVRMYGDGCRRGYRLPTKMEKLAFQILGFMPNRTNQLPPSAVRAVIRREHESSR